MRMISYSQKKRHAPRNINPFRKKAKIFYVTDVMKEDSWQLPSKRNLMNTPEDYLITFFLPDCSSLSINREFFVREIY